MLQPYNSTLLALHVAEIKGTSTYSRFRNFTALPLD